MNILARLLALWRGTTKLDGASVSLGLALELRHAPRWALQRDGRLLDLQCDVLRAACWTNGAADAGSYAPLELRPGDRVSCEAVLLTAGSIRQKNFSFEGATAVLPGYGLRSKANKAAYASRNGYCYIHVRKIKGVAARLNPHHWIYAGAYVLFSQFLESPDKVWAMTADMDTLITNFETTITGVAAAAEAARPQRSPAAELNAAGASCGEWWGNLAAYVGEATCAAAVRRTARREGLVPETSSCPAVAAAWDEMGSQTAEKAPTRMEAEEEIRGPPEMIVATDRCCLLGDRWLNSGVLLFRGTEKVVEIARQLATGSGHDGFADQMVLYDILREHLDLSALSCFCSAVAAVPSLSTPGRVVAETPGGAVAVVSSRTMNAPVHNCPRGEFYSKWQPGDFVAHFAGFAEAAGILRGERLVCDQVPEVCPRRLELQGQPLPELPFIRLCTTSTERQRAARQRERDQWARVCAKAQHLAGRAECEPTARDGVMGGWGVA